MPASNRNDTLVLCYHAVSDGWPSALAVTPASLERQLRLVVDQGYRGVTFSDAVRDGRGKVVAVTFDDGFKSVVELARPILERLDLPGTIFVPTDFVGGEAPMSWDGISHWVGGPHERELLPATWGDLRSLADEGWEIGSHTRSHPRLPQLTEGQLAGELRGSREACEASLGECRSLAYPYGDCDERVIGAARAAGYSAAGLLSSKLPRGNAMRWPRVGVFRGDGMRAFRVKVSPSIRRLRGTPLWAPAAAPLSRWRRRVGFPS